MTLTDKDAQRRIWVMVRSCSSSDWTGPAKLLAIIQSYLSHIVDDENAGWMYCRECTPEELTEHGLTQPPKPWADRVTQWAIDRNIIGGTTAKDQFGKLKEEIDELYGAICENNLPEIVDAIGDCSVVLAIIAAQYGLAFEQCQEAAWEEIKDRKGRIINGTFVKEVSE